MMMGKLDDKMIGWTQGVIYNDSILSFNNSIIQL